MVAQFSFQPLCLFGVSINVHKYSKYCTIIVSLLAVLFLEFWKRRQFILQHDWDVLGYEKAEVCTYIIIFYTWLYQGSINKEENV